MEADFRIELWLIQRYLNAVVRPDNESARLEPKVMEVLVCQAGYAGEVVSKEEMFQVAWPDTFVTDDALIRCIHERLSHLMMHLSSYSTTLNSILANRISRPYGTRPCPVA